MAIYNLYRETLSRYAMSLTRDSFKAQDLVQQVFVKVCEHQAQLRSYPKGRVEGWLIMTLKHLYIDECRRARPEPMEESVHEDDLSRQEVADMLSRLPKPIRDCVVMRHFQGMNATEIGQALNIPPATVRTRLRAGAKLLKQDYEEE